MNFGNTSESVAVAEVLVIANFVDYWKTWEMREIMRDCRGMLRLGLVGGYFGNILESRGTVDISTMVTVC